MLEKKLEKFPVVSANGVEYLAKLDTHENIVGDYVLRVRLYFKYKYKFFGFEREQFTEIQVSYFDEEGSHKYVEAVKNSVETYERELAERAELKNKIEKARNDGAHWRI